MSSDDGIIVKRYSDNEFRVYEYCANVGYETTEDMLLVGTFSDLPAALEVGTKRGTEYGISYIDAAAKEEQARNTIVIYFEDGHQEVKNGVDYVDTGEDVGSDELQENDYIIIRHVRDEKIRKEMERETENENRKDSR